MIDDATAALIKRGADAEHVSFEEAAAAALRLGAQSRYGRGSAPSSDTDPMKELINRLQEEEDLERFRQISG